MAESEKDRLAHAGVERHRDFSLALEGDGAIQPESSPRSLTLFSNTFGPFKAMNSFTEASSRRFDLFSRFVKYSERPSQLGPILWVAKRSGLATIMGHIR
jgi:hypothetical protein